MELFKILLYTRTCNVLNLALTLKQVVDTNLYQDISTSN